MPIKMIFNKEDGNKRGIFFTPLNWTGINNE